LIANGCYPITIEYFDTNQEAVMEFSWSTSPLVDFTDMASPDWGFVPSVRVYPDGAQLSTPTPTPTLTPTASPTAIPTVAPGSCPIVVNTQIALRLSPTRNSPRITTIPINTALTAVYRLDSQEGSWQEIWYQVNYSGSDGWIAAKIGADEYAALSCILPLPYPSDWIAIAQIQATDIPQGCDIDFYLRSEPSALVLARLAYGEAAGFTVLNPNTLDALGGVSYLDANRVAWIARMGAFLGLGNYGLGYAGRSTPIVEEILRQGSYAPITELRAELSANGCNPSLISSEPSPNLRRMVFPTNQPATNGDYGYVQLYELWRIYQDVVNNVINAPWTNMPNDVRGYEQFKGIQAGQVCPSGGNNLTRPGSGLSWAANQPYPPRTVYQFSDPLYGGTNGVNHSFFTCYQDIYHLDDWFWAVGINQLTNPASNSFPREFCAIDLVNPQSPSDLYVLAQLRGLDGNLWPPGMPNNPACTLFP